MVGAGPGGKARAGRFWGKNRGTQGGEENLEAPEVPDEEMTGGGRGGGEWRESAPYWKRHAPTIRAMFAPLTRALIEEAGIREGQSVLDVAGGPGEPALTIAETVGPSGSVACTDAVAEMVRAAEGEARRRGLTNVKFRQCTADSLPFDSDSFDAAVCRFGAMFFPDPLVALREMLRVTRPG